MRPKISHIFEFISSDCQFTVPPHTPYPPQPSLPTKRKPGARAEAKTPISRNRAVLGIGVVERTFTNNSNIASDSPACSVVFSDFFNKTPPFPSLVGFVDFGFAVFIIISVFGGAVLGWNGHFASAYAALSTAVLLWCSRALRVLISISPAHSDF